jgi:hypothetical protein
MKYFDTAEKRAAKVMTLDEPLSTSRRREREREEEEK